MISTKGVTTVDSIIENSASNQFQVKISLTAAIPAFIGLVFLTISPTISPYIKCEWDMTNFQVVLASSSLIIGEVVGSSYWGKMGDIYGRKYPLMFVTFGVIYFSLLSAWSTSVAWFIITRFFVGQFLGAAFLLTMVYGTEFVKCNRRELNTAVVAFYMSSGTIYSNLVAYLVINRYGWRTYSVCMAAPLLLLLPLLALLPESVRYLVVCGRTDDIIDILKNLIKGSKPEALPHTIHFQSQQQSKVNRGSLSHMFCNYTRKVVALCIIWMCLMTTYYGLSFLTVYQLQSYNNAQAANTTKCSFLSDQELLDVILINLSNFPFILIGFGIIKVFGQRVWFFVSSTLNVALFILMLFSLPQNVVKTILFIGQGVSLVSSTFIFQYTLEHFPTFIRSTSLGFCSTVGKMAAMLTPIIFQDMIYWSFPAVMVLMSTLSIVSLIALCFLEETKGVHLT